MGLARKLYGRATAGAVERTITAVVDLPMGAIRRHLIAETPLPSSLRGAARSGRSGRAARLTYNVRPAASESLAAVEEDLKAAHPPVFHRYQREVVGFHRGRISLPPEPLMHEDEVPALAGIDDPLRLARNSSNTSSIEARNSL